MVGPQHLYVDEDWANSYLRRKLFGRPRHCEESMDEGQEREVGKQQQRVTLDGALLVPTEELLLEHIHVDVMMAATHRQTDTHAAL